MLISAKQASAATHVGADGVRAGQVDALLGGAQHRLRRDGALFGAALSGFVSVQGPAVDVQATDSRQPSRPAYLHSSFTLFLTTRGARAAAQRGTSQRSACAHHDVDAAAVRAGRHDEVSALVGWFWGGPPCLGGALQCLCYGKQPAGLWALAVAAQEARGNLY